MQLMQLMQPMQLKTMGTIMLMPKRMIKTQDKY